MSGNRKFISPLLTPSVTITSLIRASHQTSKQEFFKGQKKKRVCNITRFAAGKLSENLKTVSKSQKIKPLLARKAVILSIRGKVLICLPLTLSPRTLFCHCISSNAFLRTSLCKRFELMGISKTLESACDVSFCI